VAGEPGGGDILGAIGRAGSLYSRVSRTRERGEAVVYRACGLVPVIIVNLLDSFVLSPRFCVRMYTISGTPACCTTTPPPLGCFVYLLHSPSSFWVLTAFLLTYSYCVHLIVSKPQHKPYMLEMNMGRMRHNKRSLQVWG